MNNEILCVHVLCTCPRIVTANTINFRLVQSAKTIQYKQGLRILANRLYIRADRVVASGVRV